MGKGELDRKRAGTGCHTTLADLKLIAQDDFNLQIVLLLPPKFRDYMHMLALT